MYMLDFVLYRLNRQRTSSSAVDRRYIDLHCTHDFEVVDCGAAEFYHRKQILRP